MGLLTPVEQQTKEVFGMVPMEERLSLLPRYSKTQGLIAPQFIYELAKAVSTPIVAMRGDYVSPEETLNVPLSGFAGSALGTAPKGALRTFIGRNAKTWNKASEAKFIELEKAGMSPEDIWKQTGTLRWFDGKLRQEISDKSANLTDIGNSVFTPGTIDLSKLKFKGNLESVLNHPELYQAYPRAKNIDITPSQSLEGASYSSRESPFLPQGHLAEFIKVSQSGKNPKSSILHEATHSIQANEGFSPGANLQMVSIKDIPSVYLKKAQKLRNQAEKLKDKDMLVEAMKKDAEANKILDLGRFAAYKRTPGETEARLVQNRIDLTDAERRALFPMRRGQYGIDVNSRKIKGLIE